MSKNKAPASPGKSRPSSNQKKTPSPPKLQNTLNPKTDKTVFLVICVIWGCILLFGIFTMLQPAWLKNLSGKGRVVEAREMLDRGNALMYEGDAKKSAKHFQEAAEFYQKALARDSSNAEAINNLATAWINLGKYEEALALYDKLLKTDTIHEAIVYTNLGDYYEKKQNNSRAMEYYAMAATRDPFNSYPWRKYGLYLYKNGRYQEAIAPLSRSIAIDRKFSMYYHNCLIKAYRDAIIQHNEETIALLGLKLKDPQLGNDTVKFDGTVFAQLRKSNVRAGFSYLYLGDVYAAIRDTAQARHYYNTCASFFPDLQKEVLKHLEML